MVAAKLLCNKTATDRLGICEGHGHQSQEQFVYILEPSTQNTHIFEFPSEWKMRALSFKQLCDVLFCLYICEPFALLTSKGPAPSWDIGFRQVLGRAIYTELDERQKDWGRMHMHTSFPSLRCAVNEVSPNSTSHGAVVINTVCFLTSIQTYKLAEPEMSFWFSFYHWQKKIMPTRFTVEAPKAPMGK